MLNQPKHFFWTPMRLIQVLLQKICWDSRECFLKTKSYLGVELFLNRDEYVQSLNQQFALMYSSRLLYRSVKVTKKKTLVKLLRNMGGMYLMHITSPKFKEISRVSTAVTVADPENLRSRRLFSKIGKKFSFIFVVVALT